MRTLMLSLILLLSPVQAALAGQDDMRGVLLEIDEDGALTTEALSRQGNRLRAAAFGWPGEMLRVVARDEAGEVVAEGYVLDPRFVRYEGWNTDGSHEPGSNRSFIRDFRPLLLQVSLPASAAAVEIYESSGAEDAPEEETLLAQGAIGMP